MQDTTEVIMQSDRRRKALMVEKMKPKVDVILDLMAGEKLTVEEAKVLLKLTTEHLDRKLLDTPLENVITCKDECKKASEQKATDRRKEIAEDSFNRSMDRYPKHNDTRRI